MNLVPRGDRVVVKPLKADEVRASGLVIPETANTNKPNQGEVIAVGPGRYNEETREFVSLNLEPGQKILFAKYTGTELKIDGEEVIVLSDKEILAVIEG